MAIKRIVGKRNSKYRKCLGCDKQIDATLKDNKIYTCEHCGQRHYIDVYQNCIVFTVVERPDIRRRPGEEITPEQKMARQELIERAEANRSARVKWYFEKKKNV